MLKYYVPSIYFKQLRIAIYTNDHSPPHVHVLGSDWEIKINLTDPPSLISIIGNPKRYEVRKSLLGVSLHLSVLQKMWKKYHA